jgi:hypothetical protein
MGLTMTYKSIMRLALLCKDERVVYDGRTPTQGVAIVGTVVLEAKSGVGS